MIEKNNEPTPKENLNLGKSVFNWGLFSQLGFEFAISTALPLLIFIYLGSILKFIGLNEAGDWANAHRHSSSKYKLVGILSAIFISFYIIYVKIRKIQKLIESK